MTCTFSNPVQLDGGNAWQFATMTCDDPVPFVNGSAADLVSSLFLFLIVVFLMVGFFNQKFLGIKLTKSR